MNTKRFKQLLESTMGNVKPLLNEDEPSTTKQGNANNVNNLPDLPQESLNSKKGNFTKGLKYFFNKKYPGLNLAYDGNWLDKKYNETMEKFLKEKNIPVHVCQPNDGYCRQDEAGVITTKDFNMLKQAISSDSGTQSQPSTQPIINTNHDRAYDYKLENGKYYYSKKGQNKWVEATGKGLESIKSKVRFNTQSSSNLNSALQGMGQTLQNLPKSVPQ